MVWRHEMVGAKRLKRWFFMTIGFSVIISIGFLAITFCCYRYNLRPVATIGQSEEVVIATGSSLPQISQELKTRGVIRQAWAFEWYVKQKSAARYLMAGTYVLSPTQSVSDITTILTHGKVATKLTTILPGQSIDQIKTSLIDQGFTEEETDNALDPANYSDLTVLADRPDGASLEGYLYPDSFERGPNTKASDIVRQSLLEMQQKLTTSRRDGFASQGLTTYQALIIASMVEKEAIKDSDRLQVAQVFIRRYKEGALLGSDVTAFYGSRLADRGDLVSYDTPYNTRLHAGLPPTPISNISASSLDAVANPAKTNWFYFVAGDDGVVHYSSTLAEHEALTKKYCIKLCQ